MFQYNAFKQTTNYVLKMKKYNHHLSDNKVAETLCWISLDCTVQSQSPSSLSPPACL